MVNLRARGPRWLWWLLPALGGAVLMTGLGKLLAANGGSCSILCRPEVASIYGALLGVSMFPPPRRTPDV
jgi:hypothetical protein